MNCCLVQIFRNLNLHRGVQTSRFRAGALAIFDDFQTATVLQTAPDAIAILARRTETGLTAPAGRVIPAIHWRRCDGMVSGPAVIIDFDISGSGVGKMTLEYRGELIAVRADLLRSAQVLEGQHQ